MEKELERRKSGILKTTVPSQKSPGQTGEHVKFDRVEVAEIENATVEEGKVILTASFYVKHTITHGNF